jgi:hypothetical protein
VSEHSKNLQKLSLSKIGSLSVHACAFHKYCYFRKQTSHGCHQGQSLAILQKPQNPKSLPSLSSSCQLFLQFKSISTIINGSHLGWREDMSQTVLKVDKSEIILAQIGLMVSEKKILMQSLV